MTNIESYTGDYSIETISRIILPRLQDLKDNPGQLLRGMSVARISAALTYLNSNLTERELAELQDIEPGNFRIRILRAKRDVMRLFEEQLGIPPEITKSAFDMAKQNYSQDKYRQMMRERELAWEQSDGKAWFAEFQKWLMGESRAIEPFPLYLGDSETESDLKNLLIQVIGINFSPEENRRYMFIPLLCRGLGKFMGIYDTDQSTITHQYMLTDKHETPLTSTPAHLRAKFVSPRAGLVRLLLGYGPEDVVACTQPLRVYISSTPYYGKILGYQI